MNFEIGKLPIEPKNKSRIKKKHDRKLNLLSSNLNLVQQEEPQSHRSGVKITN